MKRFVLLSILIVVSMFTVLAQEETALQESKQVEPGKVLLNIGADLASRYIWRGQNFGKSAAIQPTASISAFGLTLGAWGSYAFSRHSLQLDDSTSITYNYSELDLFISYRYKYFTLMLFDYYAPGPIDSLPGNDYFNWNNKSTFHALEASFIFDGPEKFPIQFIAAVMVYGADKGKDSTGIYGFGTKNNYSTYFELSYQFNVKGFGIKPFIGGIPFGSLWYGPKAGINNVGINISKDIPVSKKFSIPIQSNLIVNPLSKKVYLVFILSL
ncbi:MAG: hypothetical protein H8E51_10130 [Bacteroidetes bacterium]|nr:hypothetical protein [Bacteroidota bacterium]